MKNILIDTQILIWISSSKSNIKDEWLKLIENIDNNIYVSIVSFWEIAIKLSIGKLQANISLDKLFDFVYEAEIKILPITSNQIFIIKKLPFKHKDPFDRMIISQAISENFEVISSDEQFEKYQIKLL